MRLSSYILLMVIASAFSYQKVFDVEQYNHFIKMVLDYHHLYKVSNIYIARTSAARDLGVSTRLMHLLKYFSNQNVYCMITKIADIPKNFVQSNKRPGRPLFIIVIRFIEDFETFSEITRTNNLNQYQLFIIFRTMPEFCHQPIGNPFNLIYSSRALIVCDNSSIIREWYSLYPNKTEVFELWNWKPDEGFIPLTDLSFQERRSSLHGITLRFIPLKLSGVEGGYFGDIMKEVSKIAEFKMVHKSPLQKHNGGSYDPEQKKWNGIIGQLSDKEIDIGVGDFTMTVDRLEVVTFSDPVSISRTYFYVRRPQEYHLMWSMYYKAFGRKSAHCLVLFILVSPIIVALTMIRTSTASFYTNLYDNYFHVWGIFCNKSPTEVPENNPTRIAYYSLFVLSFVLYSTYSALIVSYLTIFEPALPFNSIEDFISAKSHRISTIKNSSLVDTIKISGNPWMQRLEDFLLDQMQLPDSLGGIYEQACDDNMKVILYLDEITLKNSGHVLHCTLIPFDRYELNNMAFALVRNSPYVKLVNYHLRRMRDFGILNAIEARTSRHRELPPVVYKPVDLFSTIPLFGILCFGMLLSVVALIFEYIFRYKRNRSIRNMIRLRI